MMKEKLSFGSLFLLMFVLLLVPHVAAAPSGSTIQADETKLTIYTYNTLLADPGYKFDRAFEQYAGLANGSVQVEYLDDAGQVVTKAVAEKSNPVADVLIGIDNVLVHQAREQGILEPYTPANISMLEDGLVSGLAPDHLLTPYDYGVISLWYRNDKFDGALNPNNFTLDQIKSKDFQSQLIVQDPRVSSPGLGFLLSTIAMLGDSSTNGLIDGGNWENFWRTLSTDTAMANSWLDAYTRLYAEESSRSMMVSYTTSPAYGACLYNDTTTTSILPTHDGRTYGWQQIEGIGLAKNAPHPDLAKQFIDWFLSEQLQSQIYLNQWVYPARKGIETPSCYSTSIDPSTITPLNSLLPPDMIAQHLDDWLQNWEVAWIEGPTDSNVGAAPAPFYIIIALIPLSYRYLSKYRDD